ncbi:hypothetical protein Pcinc_036828 [Petrolisthes cinctipes]|uniref:Histone-lysine N-methyltransferase n=1 Tax=Petrolisthes cinctipes TaxID=88211 RepID=A0AAE1ENA0_PETCI|nr:hypothetical protein Pcinc_036828 [Petrolisthes cinctipes]
MGDDCVVKVEKTNDAIGNNKQQNKKKKSPMLLGKVESLGKLNDIYGELNEVFTRTKQAFQLFKTKIFFYPEPDFTKPFAESLKQVEGRLQEMGNLLGAYVSRQSASPITDVGTPITTVKPNGTISITPPASEVGNDEVEVTDSTINNCGITRKRHSKEFKPDESHTPSYKKSKRSLIDDYLIKDVKSSQVVDRTPSKSEDEDVFEVESIVDIAKTQGQVTYCVKWKGYGHQDNTWEPHSNLTGCEDLLFEFYKERLKKQEESYTEEQNYHRFPIDDNSKEILFKAFQAHIIPSEKDRQNAIQIVVSSRTPTPKSKKEVDALVEKALYSRKKERYLSVVREILQDRLLIELNRERNKQLAELRGWERHINFICTDTACLSVENFIDLGLPPTEFHYINQSQAGEGVTIPSDPVVGCECEDCSSSKSCCPHQMNAMVAFNRYGKLKQQVSLGTPIYECNNLCKCGPDCVNRVVQKGRTVGLCIFRTGNSRGWGVKAMENIKRGSLVTEYVGEVITSEEAERRGHIYDAQGCTYLFDLDYNKGDQNPYTIDAAKCGNVSHFINHSCDPNLVVFNVWVNCLDPDLPRLALFATQDIKKGEELTFDYNSGLKRDQAASFSTFTGDFLTPDKNDKIKGSSEVILKTPKGNRGLQYGKTECHCGAANCRKYFF